MELKSRLWGSDYRNEGSFNCTFMELKSGITKDFSVPSEF